jgi:hypothetical protein
METNVSKKSYRLLHLDSRHKLVAGCSTKHHTGLSASPRAVSLTPGPYDSHSRRGLRLGEALAVGSR